MPENNEQSKYIIEKWNKDPDGIDDNYVIQVSRFGSDSDRIVCLVVEAFNKDEEAKVIVDALNDYLYKWNYNSAEK